MPVKPWSELSPAYRRRIERALARGLSRQAARGHAPKEPGKSEWRIRVERAEKKLEEKRKQWRKSGKRDVGLTSEQRRNIKRFVYRQARRIEEDEESVWEAFQQIFEKKGWDYYQKIKSELKFLHRKWKRTKQTQVTERMLERIAGDLLPSWMMYYH